MPYLEAIWANKILTNGFTLSPRKCLRRALRQADRRGCTHLRVRAAGTALDLKSRQNMAIHMFKINP
jgi:hypothetical protein